MDSPTKQSKNATPVVPGHIHANTIADPAWLAANLATLDAMDALGLFVIFFLS